MPNASHNCIIKIFNPIVSAVRTYRSKNLVVEIGSSEECDLQIYLPSLLPVHLIVNFEDEKITAMGNDVHCDTVSIVQGTSTQFSNDSVVRIHNIFIMLLKLENIEKMDEYDNKIVAASARFKEYSPILKISHNDNTSEMIDNEISKPINTIDENEELFVSKLKDINSDLLNDSYKKELGDFSKMPHLKPSDMIDESSAIKNLIKKTEDEFIEEYNVNPPSEIVEAVIHKEINETTQEIRDILNGDVNISISKTPKADLGDVAIKNDLLRQTEAALNNVNDVIEAEINSIEQLKNNITDTIKEEVREEISHVIQEETREQVGKIIKECISEIVTEENVKRTKSDLEIEESKEIESKEKNEDANKVKSKKLDAEDDSKKNVAKKKEDIKKKSKDIKKNKKDAISKDNSKKKEDIKKKSKDIKKNKKDAISKDNSKKKEDIKKNKNSSTNLDTNKKEKEVSPVKKRPTRKAASKNK